MKIIVMDSANVRIEVLNVPDHMIDEDIEKFLAEHDYSLNNISWMAAPIDFVPVQFHEYGICQTNGKELHVVRHARLKLLVLLNPQSAKSVLACIIGDTCHFVS